MGEYAKDELTRQLERGPYAGEDFFRLQVTGDGATKHLNISRAELAAIRDAVSGDLIVGAFTPAEWELIAEALDSHLYWQVNDDHSRRDSGFIQEPYTPEEREVVDLETRVSGLLRPCDACGEGDGRPCAVCGAGHDD